MKLKAIVTAKYLGLDHKFSKLEDYVTNYVKNYHFGTKLPPVSSLWITFKRNYNFE